MKPMVQPEENVRARRGVVLLIVLVMLTLASISTTTIASQSLALASQSLIEEKKLRDRWAIISINSSFTPRAELMIERESESSAERVRSLALTIVLSGRSYQVRIDDEDAKVNLQSLLAYGGQESFNSRLQQLSNEKRLYLSSPAQKHGATISSWSELLHEDEENQEIIWIGSENLSLYGSGRLNIRSADIETIRHTIESALNNQIANLIISRLAKEKKASVGEMSLGLRNLQREKLAKIISDQSITYSIWIRSQEESDSLQVQLIDIRNGRRFTESIVW